MLDYLEPTSDASDWYFLERQKNSNNNNNNNNVKLHNGDAGREEVGWRLNANDESATSKTKDFLAAELSAMSKLSLYEGDDDKIKLDDK